MKKIKISNKVKTVTKTLAELAVGYGVGEFVGSIVKDFTPDAKGIKKMAIKIGGLAITGLVVKTTVDYICDEIDDIFESVEDIANEELERKMNNKKEETKE